MFSAAHTSWMHRIRLILIGMCGSSFGMQIWRELAHTLGGSPNQKADIIISAKGSKASSLLVSAFQ
jgi:hypothetical protein